jgi:hypothetical protein
VVLESSGIRRVGEKIVIVPTAHCTFPGGDIVEGLVHVLLLKSQPFDLDSHFTLDLNALVEVKHVGVCIAAFLCHVIGSVLLQGISHR